jgi:hypothetical protein
MTRVPPTPREAIPAEITPEEAERAHLEMMEAGVQPSGPAEITPERTAFNYLERIGGARARLPREPLNPTPTFDYSSLLDADVARVQHALSIGDHHQIFGYIPEKALQFVLSNYKRLSDHGILEQNWMQAYLHASHLNDVSLSLLQEIFDACDKQVLQKHYPIPVLYWLPDSDWLGVLASRRGERISLFRGCAGPEHRMGMSWIASLDKAIWYAAKHAAYYQLTNLAVYATTVHRDEIYCCGYQYDFDFIVRPKTWWPVDVPESEFRLDRERW